jgi:hypothetical protein
MGYQANFFNQNVCDWNVFIISNMKGDDIHVPNTSSVTVIISCSMMQAPSINMGDWDV